MNTPTTTKKKSRRAPPLPMRLASRAIHTADRVRREYNDDGLADFLVSLGEERRNYARDEYTSRLNAAHRDAVDNHARNIAVNALIEITAIHNNRRDDTDGARAMNAKARSALNALGIKP